MRRRTLLAALGTTLVAGCGGRRDPGPDTPDDGAETATITTAGTVTEAGTPAPTGTATASPTPAPTTTAGVPTHALGEPFAVDGAPTVAYTFHRLGTADRLGPIGREPDQGVFLVAECTVVNRGGSATAVPIESIALRGGVRRFARQDDTDAASADDRLDLPPLTDETMFSGVPLRGVLAYDVPSDPRNDLYVRITPPNADDPEHHVPVGSVARLPSL